MRELSGDYIAGAKKNIRDVNVRIEVGDGKMYYSEDIISIDIQSSITSGAFGIGATPSDRLSLKFYGTEKLQENAKISVFVSFNNGSYEQLGLFYCSECARSGKIISVTAYDKMYRQDKKYCKFTGANSIGLAALEFPCTMQDMLDYICAFRSIECEFECQPFAVQKKPMKSETEYYTVREIIGFIASAHGCNAHFNLDNVLVFKEYSEASAGISMSDVIDQEVDDNEAFTVTGVLFNVDNETQIYIDDTEGSEYDEEAEGVISVNNPLASVEIAEYVWNKLGNLSYHGGSIKMRGCGIIECGDIIEVENYKLPENKESYPMCITDIVYSINRSGGFTEVIKSERRKSGKTQATNEKQSDKASSDSSLLSSVTFEKNRLYYNGETYYLQFGFNKRIMCVTKGNKYALINSEGYAESRVEAATAVMNGLTEDWDLEFDYYTGAGSDLDITRIAQGCSGVTKCDWGDGTTDSETTHSYSITAPVRVKVKLSGCSGITLRFNSLTWATEGNSRYEEGYGAGIHIGGNFEIVNVYCNLYADYITFGEKVKRINESWSGSIFSAPSTASKRGHEHGIPPFVEVIGSPTFQYSGSSYLYIPESCTSIKDDAFYCGCASEIEIEPKGKTLTLGRCFRKPDSCTGGNSVTKLNIPARVKASASGVFEGCGVGAVKFEKGCTEITYELSYNMDYSCGHFKALNNAEPCFIFIPDTVTTIGNNLITSDLNGRQVYIIFGGLKTKWDAVAKAANWDGASGSRENVTVICDSDLYNRYDNVARSYVRR